MDSGEVWLVVVLGVILPLSWPVPFGIIILIGYWRNEPGRMLGLLALKFVLGYILMSSTSFMLSNSINLDVLLSLLPYAVLTGAMIYGYRRLLRINQIARIAMLADIGFWTLLAVSWFVLNSSMGFAIPFVYTLFMLALLMVWMFKQRRLARSI